MLNKIGTKESVTNRDSTSLFHRSNGWSHIRSTGGHRQFKHPFKVGRVTVAGALGVDVPVKTLKSIWKQAGLLEET